MRNTVIFAAMAAVSTVVAGRAAQAPSTEIRLSVELPDNPAAGARLFVEKQCVRCHALGGEEHRVGPDLGRIHIIGTVLDVAGAFWNHAPVMREKMRDMKIAPPALTASEMADLLAFLTAYRYYLTEIGVPGNAARGEAVFRAKSCVRCHGAANDWDYPGPSLDRYRGRFSAIQMAEAMWNHGRDMAPVMRAHGVAWPKFVGAEMGDLLAYLQAGNEGVSGERVYFEPGSPRRGERLFKEKRCLSCHAVAGRGGRVGPDLGSRRRDLVGSVSSIAGLMWNHSPVMTAEARRLRIPAVTFSGQEMADIIAYLYFVNYTTVTGSPDRGERLFTSRCGGCHSVGDGPNVGPDLRTAPGLDEPLALITTMWNSAPKMAEALGKNGEAWPRFEPGEAADLTAFLMTRRNGTSAAGRGDR